MARAASIFSPAVRHLLQPLAGEPQRGPGGCAGVTQQRRRCRRQVYGFDLVCGVCGSWQTLHPLLPTSLRDAYRTLGRACRSIPGVDFRGVGRNPTGALQIHVVDGVHPEEAAARLDRAQVLPADALVVQRLTFRRYLSTAFLLHERGQLDVHLERAIDQTLSEAPFERNDTDYSTQPLFLSRGPGGYAYWLHNGPLPVHAFDHSLARAAVQFLSATRNFDEDGLRFYSELRQQGNSVEAAAEIVTLLLGGGDGEG